MSQSNDKKESKEEETELSLEEGFQVNILDLIAVFASFAKKITDKGVKSPVYMSMFSVAETYIKSQKSDKLIYDFIESSNKSWSKYDSKDEAILFSNVKSLFPAIPQAGIDSLIAMLSIRDNKNRSIITDEDKKSIWEYVLEFIRMSVLYIHEQRCWGDKQGGGRGYTKVFFKEIKVSEYATMFKVALNRD